MYDNYFAVIMAGGGGTRLWPLSRKSRPKQMLSLGSTRSLFQVAVDRLEGLFSPDRILVVTVEDQAPHLKDQCPSIPAENFLLETMPRGTAAVVGYAASILDKKNPQSIMAVLTADHIIGNLKLFHAILKSAYLIADQEKLVTLGVTPTYPATGYGYIKKGQSIGIYEEIESYQVLEFIEKPQLNKAERMFAGEDYSWNSGMFIWRTDVILEEISRQMPELSQQLAAIQKAWGTIEQEMTIRELWPKIQPQTIDFGIMENAKQVAVIPAAGLEWNDVGSWEALFDLLGQDPNGNIIQDVQHLGLDTNGSIIFGSDPSRTVVTVGVEDLIVVDTEDVLLLCARDQAQRVREIVSRLKDEGRLDLI